MNDYKGIEFNTIFVEILKKATPKQLQCCSPHVKKLVEALEFIAKPHVGMSKIPVNKNGSVCVERAKEALAEFGVE